jgi:antirestriction protein ArdC
MVDATIEAHADYVQSWLPVLKNDKRAAIFTAAGQAAKAADFILAFGLASAQLNKGRSAL